MSVILDRGSRMAAHFMYRMQTRTSSADEVKNQDGQLVPLPYGFGVLTNIDTGVSESDTKS